MAHKFVSIPLIALGVLVPFLLLNGVDRPDVPQGEVSPEKEYAKEVRPALQKYCLGCHSAKTRKGDLDLERFDSFAAVRKDLKPWQHLIEQVEAGEMPPPGKPQPTAQERKALVAWARAVIDREARAAKGDPGHVPLRRLSNTEYDCTVRDLTGVDLKPAREFPADGAGGEGFTNAGESLSDVTPALLARYLAAAKGIADHAVLLPDGFRFSPSTTRRDWTDEATAALRKFYAGLGVAAAEGRLAVQPYLLATVRHRAALADGKFEEVAANEKLNPKYLLALWQALRDATPSQPLDSIREKWRAASEKDIAGLAADVAAWQTTLWTTVRVGNYVRETWGSSASSPKGYEESSSRQVAVDPPALESVPLQIALKPRPGESVVSVYLAAREEKPGGLVRWSRPRLEKSGQMPLLLQDYAKFGPAFEVDCRSAFANASQYLAAAAHLAGDPQGSPEMLAKQRGLDAAFLKQWVKVLTLMPDKKSGLSPAPLVPANSVLGRWRVAALDPAAREGAEKLSREVEARLSGPRPADEKDPDRLLYDRLVVADGPLFAGVDMADIAKRLPPAGLGLPTEPSAKREGDSIVAPGDKVLEIRLPAALVAGRTFVVEARAEGAAGQRLLQVHAGTSAPDAQTRWGGPVVTAPDSPAYRQMLAGHDAFRRVFPLFVCFPQVVPTDEIVTLKMFHREDEPLIQLFLTEEQVGQLDRLWRELRFVGRQPIAEFDYLPQFMGFTTQDTPKAFQQFFIDRKPRFEKLAEEFKGELAAAEPKHLAALLDFAARAYRRPLQEKEKAELLATYEKLRTKGTAHDEAFRGALARVFVAPAFLFRIEQPPLGKGPGPVNDWELAARLSYFLWSSLPDEELRRVAAAGGLRDPEVLAAQTKRMLANERLRALAIEFGTQWIHVRDFDALKEKSEKLFPTFTPDLRMAIYEESILFFEDLFKHDRPVASLLDADATYLNEMLAKHYGIPGVQGPHFRRVEGIRKYGRGGLLGLASVQAKQSGASRTSPVLRGNWVVETLLGEKLPRPPANVPILPDEEGGKDKLTTRQMVERHVSDQGCAACHVRIDPYGFAFENFDAIGRWRTKEVSGLAVDTRARLRDGAEFEGIDGLRHYLMTKKKEVIVRLFCQRLLGYALGRATTLADTTLIDEMVAALDANEGRVSAAILTIVRSPQFRMIRGADASND